MHRIDAIWIKQDKRKLNQLQLPQDPQSCTMAFCVTEQLVKESAIKPLHRSYIVHKLQTHKKILWRNLYLHKIQIIPNPRISLQYDTQLNISVYSVRPQNPNSYDKMSTSSQTFFYSGTSSHCTLKEEAIMVMAHKHQML